SALRGRGELHDTAGRTAAAADDLVRARDGFQSLAAAQSAAPEDVVNFASACTAVATVHHKLKRDGDALKEYGQAVDALEPLLLTRADRRDVRVQLARALFERGKLLSAAQRDDRAEADFVRSCDVRKPLAESGDAVAEDVREQGTAYYNLAVVRERLK